MHRTPPHSPHRLLDDLESIRDLLDEPSSEPPLLTDSLDDDLDEDQLEIPLLDEVVPQRPASNTVKAAPSLPPKPAASAALTQPPKQTLTPPATSQPAPPQATHSATGKPPAEKLDPAIRAAQAINQRPNSIKEALAESLRQGHIQPPSDEHDTPTTFSASQLRLDNELRAAAQLILQELIDDYVPRIEAELKQRLEARLSRLLPPRKS